MARKIITPEAEVLMAKLEKTIRWVETGQWEEALAELGRNCAFCEKYASVGFRNPRMRCFKCPIFKHYGRECLSSHRYRRMILAIERKQQATATLQIKDSMRWIMDY